MDDRCDEGEGGVYCLELVNALKTSDCDVGLDDSDDPLDDGGLVARPGEGERSLRVGTPRTALYTE